MVFVKPFVLDNWVRQFKPLASASLHGVEGRLDTCVDPLSLQELSQLQAPSSSTGPINASNALLYGSVLGSLGLRDKILSLYASDVTDPAEELSLTVMQGAISANFLVLDTLLGPGDHVICQYPTYQQLYDVPRRAGAQVTLWRTCQEKRWIPDTTELSSLVKENTRMIIINNPNNPTGASIPFRVLEEIVSFAEKRGIIILSDEVFRPLFHRPTESPPSIIAFAGWYKNIIATSSLSKAYSLPGIRVGWVISPNADLVHQVVMARDYTTISVSQIDQDIATYALDAPVRERILQRSLAACERNLATLGKFIASHADHLRWVKPSGASAAFVQVIDPDIGAPVNDKSYCEELVRKTGLLIVPGGETFGTEDEKDFKGYLRVGFVCSPERFEQALAIWDEYLNWDQHLESNR
ncbi:aspartate aminotransferase [Penicillium longicatenatum]|uniref:aspartate aminotransferase n=1 Tax=Penicillium longicatenatum TaxID=1561947 RepID=UPI0025468227|nr:aspartate aminotransferase [Penicillium longicatenatum]KAJ5643316.1 aspartate aminotransferase [Penicillium longicatenatum]